jgi:hypothetical protein
MVGTRIPSLGAHSRDPPTLQLSPLTTVRITTPSLRSTGRANARPMTGSAKQSIAQQLEKWIASLRSQ